MADDQDKTSEKRPLLSTSDNGNHASGKKRAALDSSTGSTLSTLQIHTQYQPKPLSQFSPQKLLVVMCILLTEMCERLSYYSVVANMVLFCTSVLKFTSNDAATISLVFSGTVYLIPIVGGYIADARAGMFNTIYGSALIYLLGLFLLPASAVSYSTLFDGDYPLSVEWRRAMFLAALVFIALGTGGIKANVGPFGAQQVQDVGPQAVQTFFNWFYWFVNAGALIAYVAVAAVQQNVSFALGFLIPFITMLLAIFFFLVARKNYVHKQLKGSMLGDSFTVCWQGCSGRSPEEKETQGFFDTARIPYGGSYDDSTVDGVIAVVRVLPIFFFVIMYWAIYSQMQSTFFIQGERMDLHVGGWQVPVAMLNAFNTIAIMIIIPILDRVIYPCFQRLGRPLNHLHRIGVGLILALLSMVVAGVVEIERKKHFGFEQTVGDETFHASNISIFLQIPQFALVGASEAFTSISGLEFAYTQAPTSMQGMMMGVFLATSGLGNYLASAILKIVEDATEDDPWFPNEINNGKAENLFFLLAGMMGAFFLFYLVAAKLYKYKTFDSKFDVEPHEKKGDASRQSVAEDTVF